MSWFGLLVRCYAGKQKDLGLIPLQLSLLFKRLWFVDTVLWLCPSLPTKTLKWLSSLPILMQESFWWWQCSDRYIISLSPHLHAPFPLSSPSLISIMVYVDVKHCVYLQIAYSKEQGKCIHQKAGHRHQKLLNVLTLYVFIRKKEMMNWRQIENEKNLSSVNHFFYLFLMTYCQNVDFLIILVWVCLLQQHTFVEVKSKTFVYFYIYLFLIFFIYFFHQSKEK